MFTAPERATVSLVSTCVPTRLMETLVRRYADRHGSGANGPNDVMGTDERRPLTWHRSG